MATRKASGYVKRFTVRGAGPFPLDMLRYDCCWPSSSEAAATMLQEGPRRVTLLAFLENASNVTVARWASFGWLVVEG